MAIPPGTALGPYRIVAQIGAGGMGEVYRAEDPNLERLVAIKVLPAHLGGHPDLLARFEREAKAIAALSHPNILGIHDFGREGGTVYAVMELLEGETLRERLRAGPLPPRKVLEWGLQMAYGLAAAHERGILHRDIKPENLFLTREGRVKILDFGLAKRLDLEGPAGETRAPGEAGRTLGGALLGTVGYMSPEQARGEPADARSDIFSLGAVLYEMLTGRKAFEKPSAAETFAAILNEDPPDADPAKGSLPPGLERIVRHALEKRPEARFQSARDLAFDLENLTAFSLGGPSVSAGPRVSMSHSWTALLVAALLGTGGLFGVRALRRPPPAPQPSFARVSFRQGAVRSARFTADGGGFVYSAAWEGALPELFASRLDSLEDRPLGLRDAHLLALSPAGDMALLEKVEGPFGWTYRGRLARASLGGSAPKALLDGVEWADWAPDGGLALVRTVGERGRLEFPPGRVRAETPGWYSHPRFSPDGAFLAYIEHPLPGYSHGSVKVLDLGRGRAETLGGESSSVEGLAWKGGEVWFTRTERGFDRALWAARPGGAARLLLRGPGCLTLHDIGREGRALLAFEETRTGVLHVRGAAVRDLSWRTWSVLRGLSADGRTILFDEEGEAPGPDYDIYLRPTDGSPAVRVGQGSPSALSPEGAWVAAIQHVPEPHPVLLPTGTGEARHLPGLGIGSYHGALAFTPDGGGLVFSGSRPGEGPRLYFQGLEGAALRPLTPEGTAPLLGERFLAPSGGRFVARSREGALLFRFEAPAPPPVPVPGLDPAERILHWDAGGRLLVYRPGPLPVQVWRLDPATGRRAPWRQVAPAGYQGDLLSHTARLGPGESDLVLVYRRQRSVLYVVDGLR